MRTAVILLAAAILLPVCGSRDDVRPTNASKVVSPTPVPTNATPKDGNYNAKGKVTKIDKTAGSVELDHEDIPGLMPRMVMEFYVSDKVLLDGLAAGDAVDFTIEYKHPSEKIIAIKKAP